MSGGACAYTVAKAGKRWAVLKDGDTVKMDGCAYGATYQTKREALAEIPKFMAGDEWRERLFEDDRTGVYHWTVDDTKQINDYAEVLRANELRWTFGGEFTAQVIARQQHAKDAEDIAKPDSYWIDAARVRAEKRRIRAARVEAWRRAGIEEPL
jgi:hypothetical protein